MNTVKDLEGSEKLLLMCGMCGMCGFVWGFCDLATCFSFLAFNRFNRRASSSSLGVGGCVVLTTAGPLSQRVSLGRGAVGGNGVEGIAS